MAKTELEQNTLDISNYYEHAMSKLSKLPAYTDEEKAARGHLQANLQKLKDKALELAQLSYNLESIM